VNPVSPSAVTNDTTSPDLFRPALPVNANDSYHWGKLYGSSRGLAIFNAAKLAQAPLIVLTADIKTAENLMEELRFFGEAAADIPLLTFPDWETLPYDIFSPYQDIISERLATLTRLSTLHKGILVVPVSTVMHRLMPASYLHARSLDIRTGQRLDIEEFRNRLVQNGYRLVSQVIEHGDIAIRGSLLDIYPMGLRQPYRLDLFGDEVDSIRIFDPETQRSIEKVERMTVLPAREVSLVEETINRFRSNWRNRFQGSPSSSHIYTDVTNGMAPAGIEYYLPLFYETTSSLFDYLPLTGLVIIDEGVETAADSFWRDIQRRYEQGRYDIERPLLPPDQLFFSPEDLTARLQTHTRVFCQGLAVNDRLHAFNYATRTPLQMPVDIRAREPLGMLQRFIAEFAGRVLILAESPGRRETLSEMFRNHGLTPRQVKGWDEFLHSDATLALAIAPVQNGTIVDQPHIAIISESQLFGERVQQRRLRKRRQSESDALVKSLAELTIGAPVVHEDNGVGRYLGLITLEVGGILNEFICLEYDKGDKLYVPVSALNLISRYTGADPEHAPLHRLGSNQWQKAKERASKRVVDVAAELLELHARRAARTGNSFQFDEDAYLGFVQGFPFEETPDQLDAINAVLADMKQAKPMDRLICGDAGFGKTEVAMRAAFIAVNGGKQVGILVPTTLLAQQHYQNFRDRFADWPFRIEVLSRFVDRKQQDDVIRDIENGKVDIVIGTHRLLQDDIRFSRLGLIVIDEEHRFGVRQKEKFRAIRAEIDVLTLTATPIPRTLNMAIAELRDLSIIASPPSRRQAIKTFVFEWRDQILQEAIQREIQRGGQVYFLHNEVDSIEKQAEKVQALVPEARVQFAHGQMPEKQLEQVMLDFYHRRFNILVCTTIIETGIDVPSANTIIINRADKFGLAQLYQLRGRVGRSHHRAYAYLLIPSLKSITKDAIKRLEVIESLEDLGIGFTLAIHDLEIRGAGEILGEEQSGQIQEIGFGLYMDLLDRAVRALKSGNQPRLDRPLDHGAEVEFHVPSLIPQDYLADVQTRLIMYKRIASARDDEDLVSLQEEMIDRFGLLPEPLKNLFAITRLKHRAAPLGIRKIEMGAKGGRILFENVTRIDPVRIIMLIQKEARTYKLDGSDKLKIIREFADVQSRLDFLYDLFDKIALGDTA
jgi:transcription-repair coupling factor (superfamily II helicase)